MKVCKFGGSSVADAGQVEKVCSIVESDPERRLVVVSAPGKRNSADTKVTDLLIRCARRRLAGEPLETDVAIVVERFAGIARELGITDGTAAAIESDLNARLSGSTKREERFLDAVKAAGEDYSARLIAAALRARGVKAQYVSPGDAGLVLSSEFGNAQVLPESYARLKSLKRRRGVVVFPGFFGVTKSGEVVTFPRGGSDITGAILSAAVGAEVYENFTDVDSVFAADPRVIQDVCPIPELTLREMRELSYAGFGVIHEEAIMPAVHAGIPICIKNTNAPDKPGTRIVRERKYEHGSIVGIAGDRGFCTLFISKYLMNREVGFGRRALSVLEREGVSYEHCPSGIDNMSVVMRESQLDAAKEERIVAALRDELGADDVEMERGLALIMVVGEGMRFTVGLASRATRALAAAGVNIEMMNQGSSEISMMFGVKAEDRERAIRSLYGEFFAQSGRGRGK
jgi:aspartate kinase